LLLHVAFVVAAAADERSRVLTRRPDD
jgi:hypothetical protein